MKCYTCHMGNHSGTNGTPGCNGGDCHCSCQIRKAGAEAGTEAGTAAGSWIIDGNTSTEQAQAVLDAIEECEFEFPSPLSGEWAGESIPEIVTNAGLDYEALDTEDMADRNDLDTFLDAYEEAFHMAYEAEVTLAATYLVS